MSYVVGIDVGGTFTDFALVDDSGQWETHKSPSTPDDLSEGLLTGLAEIAERRGEDLSALLQKVGVLLHGTTVTTNAVLTGSGVRTGLLTTEGFRDVLEMRRGRRETTRDNKYLAPEPLVPRYLRMPVAERVDRDGRVEREVQIEDVRRALSLFRAQDVAAIAISFLHSYANSANEQTVLEMLERECPDLYVTASSELLPQVRFYPRVSTTVLNAYIGPIIARYLARLDERLRACGFRGVLLIMQSNGGVMSIEVAKRQAAATLLSGPAAGPTAGLVCAGQQDFDDCITLDMGGTSCDVALIRDRRPLMLTDGWVNRQHIALPMLGIHTVGAGGGSIAFIEGGLIRVGPLTAGAMPGPACYGRGGERPTVTDADLVLGYLDPQRFLGGRMPLQPELAERAIAHEVGRPLKMSVLEAAAAIYEVVNINMTEGTRELAVQQGIEAQEMPLVVGGGAGPVHAGEIALELGIETVIIPRDSALFCAFGLLLSDFRHDYVRSRPMRCATADVPGLLTLLDAMEAEGRERLRRERIAEGAMEFHQSLDMRYVGQFHEVEVPVQRSDFQAGISTVVEQFHALHDRLYGYAELDAAVEILNVRVVAIGRTPKPPLPKRSTNGSTKPPAPPRATRRAWEPRMRRMVEMPVYDGERLMAGQRFLGPSLVEAPATTVVVPAAFNLTCDDYGNFVLRSRNGDE